MGLSIDKISGQRQEVEDYTRKIELIEKEANGGEITRENLEGLGISASDLEKLITNDILEMGEEMGEETIYTLKQETIDKEPLEDFERLDKAA